MRKVEFVDEHDTLQAERLRFLTTRLQQDKTKLTIYALPDQASEQSLTSYENRKLKPYNQSVICKDCGEDSADRNRGNMKVFSRAEKLSSNSRKENIVNHLHYQTIESSQQCEIEGNLGRSSSTKRKLKNDLEQDFFPIMSDRMGLVSPEYTPLLQKKTKEAGNRLNWPQKLSDVDAHQLGHSGCQQNLYELACKSKTVGHDLFQYLGNSRSWGSGVSWKSLASASVGTLPAVTLGVLLNILDALSYGRILFPIGQTPFGKLGPAGISIFYMSCIVSQLVFSCGGSGFRGGVGSEMIEIIPFFHSMAGTISKDMEGSSASAIIATTIVAYASSSVLTGVLFFLFGYFQIGYIIGFIPRHILIGCIGGVGWFLVATGIEVTANLDKFEYAAVTFKKLFHTENLPFWTIPLGLAIFQIYTERLLKFKYYLPAFILLIPIIFYTIIVSLSELTVSNLRISGWIFHGPEAGEPWCLVNWSSIAKCIPAMLALTFFGIIHVPINVPSLAFALKKDDFDLNRELLAHGASNAISGLFGSVQNYLVYTNSLIVIKSGGGSRLGGALIAVATGLIMVVGSSIIEYIPRMMVGALIYILGFSLIEEAVWKSRKKLKKLEYFTVLVIVVVMGIYDFVVGIFVGIGLAFIFLVFQTSQIPAVRSTYSGEIVGSTVRRSPAQHRYLKDVGRQIQVVKLSGYIFFGTISRVQRRMQQMIDRDEFEKRPIRFLIIDLYHVTGMDYSAAEAFCRINRIMSQKRIRIIMSGFNRCGELRSSLEAVDVSGDGEVKMFEDLNSALESCENELLKAFHVRREARLGELINPNNLNVLENEIIDQNLSVDGFASSPRVGHLFQASEITLDESPDELRYVKLKDPLRLILQIFTPLTEKNERFWLSAIPYFKKKHFPAGSVIFRKGSKAEAFYLIQEGVMRAEYELPQGRLREKVLAGTTCGELNFFAEKTRTATVIAERDCIAWFVDLKNWKTLQNKEPEIAQELLRIGLKITSERMKSITGYVLTIAN